MAVGRRLSPALAFSTRAILRTYTVKLMATVATVPPPSPAPAAAAAAAAAPLAEKPVCSEFTLTERRRFPRTAVYTHVYTDTLWNSNGGGGRGRVPREISRSLPIVRFITRSDIYILLKNFKFGRTDVWRPREFHRRHSIGITRTILPPPLRVCGRIQGLINARDKPNSFLIRVPLYLCTRASCC